MFFFLLNKSILILIYRFNLIIPSEKHLLKQVENYFQKSITEFSERYIDDDEPYKALDVSPFDTSFSEVSTSESKLLFQFIQPSLTDASKLPLPPNSSSVNSHLLKDQDGFVDDRSDLDEPFYSSAKFEDFNLKPGLLRGNFTK
jgi:hypothetical protein